MVLVCGLMVFIFLILFWRERVKSKEVNMLKNELKRQKELNQQLRNEIFIWYKKS